MAEEIVLSVNSSSQIAERLDADQVPGAATADQRTLRHNRAGVTDTFSKDTAVKPRKVVSLEVTIDGTGIFDIDLTAAPLSVNRVEDLTGERLHYLELETPEANVGQVTIDCSQANPFPLFGAANVDFILQPFDRLQRVLQNNDGPAIGAGAKAIRISGTEDDVCRLKLVFGD